MNNKKIEIALKALKKVHEKMIQGKLLILDKEGKIEIRDTAFVMGMVMAALSFLEDKELEE